MITKCKSDFERAMESIAETFVIRGGQLFAIILGLAFIYMGGKLIYALFSLGLPSGTNFVLTLVGVFFIVCGIVAVRKWKTLMIT
jgi:hypothetical protein